MTSRTLFFFFTTIVLYPHLAYSQINKSSEQKLEDIAKVTSLIVTCEAGDFIILTQGPSDKVDWKIIRFDGKKTDESEVKLEKGKSLQTLFSAVQNSKNAELDKNPDVPISKHHLIIHHSKGISIIPLSLAQQQTIVMSPFFQGIRDLPYLNADGGGVGGFLVMKNRFLGPLNYSKLPEDNGKPEFPTPDISM